jgi:hypothetical protein
MPEKSLSNGLCTNCDITEDSSSNGLLEWLLVVTKMKLILTGLIDHATVPDKPVAGAKCQQFYKRME